MCGIFGFVLKRPIPMAGVMKVLEKLEVHQYAEETNPIGGYGAGVAVLTNDGSVVLEKVGKVSESPAKTLADIVLANFSEASVLIGHVRFPSPEFMSTAQMKETAQPYIVENDPDLTVASVHNGKVENYKDLRARVPVAHVFESEKTQLIDSEVIPHYFEELLEETENPDEAAYSMFNSLQGSNSLAIVQATGEDAYLHILHKGKSRGLTVWTNDRKEVMFCSRKEPLKTELKDVLSKRRFREKVSIGYHEDAGLKLTFPAVFG